MKKSLALLCIPFLFGCGFENKTPSFETPVPSAEEIESTGNPFEENSSESFVLIPENSEFYWKSKKVSGSSHEGLVFMEDGTLTRTEDGTFEGQFTINLEDIVVLDLEGDKAEKLITHLKSDDFFSVESFPRATFSITKSEKKSEDTFTVSGNLTIKGITNPITFELKLLTIEGILVALADINIDRTLWDIRFGSGKFFENLGDSMIDDIIETKVTLSFLPSELFEE